MEKPAEKEKNLDAGEKVVYNQSTLEIHGAAISGKGRFLFRGV